MGDEFSGVGDFYDFVYLYELVVCIDKQKPWNDCSTCCVHVLRGLLNFF